MDLNPPSIPPTHPDRVRAGESSGNEDSLGGTVSEFSRTHVRPNELLMSSDGATSVGRAEGASEPGGRHKLVPEVG